MWMNIEQTYSTPHSMNAWARLPNQGFRKVKPLATDGVTNTFLLLALARATNKQAHVTTDGANEITAVYF
jgi:immune inhibitor A